ncbi:MAG: MFS transporter, partial [Bacteroides sp.]
MNNNKYMSTHKLNQSPVTWVPTVYFAMGLPFVVLNMVAVLMYKGMG